LRFTITGDISANIDEQSGIFFSFWINDDGAWGANGIIELYYSSTQIMKIQVKGSTSNYIRANWVGGATSQNVNTPIVVNTNYRCGYTQDCTANTHAIDCVTTGSVAWTSNSGVPDDEDEEAIDPFIDDVTPVDPTTFVLGEDISELGGEETVRIWDVFIVPGYKPTDPGSL